MTSKSKCAIIIPMKWILLTEEDIKKSWLKKDEVSVDPNYDYVYLEMEKSDWQDYFKYYTGLANKNNAEKFSKVSEYQNQFVEYLAHISNRQKLNFFFFDYLHPTQKKAKVYYFPKNCISEELVNDANASEDREHQQSYLLKQSKIQKKLEEVLEAVENRYNSLPIVDNEYQILNRLDAEGNPYKVYPHQKEGADFLLSRKRALLDYEVGLGKSITALLACNYAVKPGKKALIICEKKLISYWKEEARLQEVPADVINYEKCRKLLTKSMDKVLEYNPYGIELKNYDVVIVDESHLLANFTKNGKAVLKFLDNFKGHIYSLTATPYRNSLADYHFQMALLKHPLGALSRNQFRLLFGIDTEAEPKLETFKKLTNPIIITKTLAEIGKNFNIETHLERIQMQEEIKEEYKNIVKFAKDRIILDRNEKTQTIQDCVMRLQKLCSKAKVNWTTNFLKEQTDKKVVVISNYNVDVLDTIAENLEMSVYKGETINKDEAIKDFTEGENQYFLAQRKIAQTGLNLQASETLLLHDLHWSLDSFIQSVGRIKRINQKNETLHVHIPVLAGTIEERVLKVILKKMDEHESILGRDSGIKRNLATASHKAMTKMEIKQIIEEEFSLSYSL